MAKIELGKLGTALNPDEGPAFVDAAGALEEAGFTAFWTGGPIESLEPYRSLCRATTSARVGGNIIAVDRFDSDQVVALYRDLESTGPGRFVVGLGGAHGPDPFGTLNTYLDELDAAAVPATRRILAALGPRMLDLAGRRASGALPVMVTPDRTAWTREQLGDDSTLVVQQMVVFETDPQQARSVARGPLGFLGDVPAYQAHFRRMGFSDEEIAQRADRLVDELAAWGDSDAIAARLSAHLQAGADHVIAWVVSASPGPPPIGPMRQLADQLVNA